MHHPLLLRRLHCVCAVASSFGKSIVPSSVHPETYDRISRLHLKILCHWIHHFPRIQHDGPILLGYACISRRSFLSWILRIFISCYSTFFPSSMLLIGRKTEKPPLFCPFLGGSEEGHRQGRGPSPSSSSVPVLRTVPTPAGGGRCLHAAAMAPMHWTLRRQGGGRPSNLVVYPITYHSSIYFFHLPRPRSTTDGPLAGKASAWAWA